MPVSNPSRTISEAVASQERLPLQFYKGVGPVRAQILAHQGIQTPQDLSSYFPRDWEDRRLRFSIAVSPLQTKTTLVGTITQIQFRKLRSDLGLAIATLEDNSGKINAVWFKKTNPRYDVFLTLRQKLQTGKAIMVFGMVEIGIQGKQIQVEEMAFIVKPPALLSEEDSLHLNRIVPVYPQISGLSDRLIRSLISRALPTLQVESILPPDIAKKKGIADKAKTLRQFHFPNTLLEKEMARESLAFEEFFILETALGILRHRIKKEFKKHLYLLRRTLLTPFREGLGITFTSAQKRVIREIFNDLLQPHPMNRLLQGDVGSGKTLVALSAMLLAVENGGQAVLMAPTEILAEQHALTFTRFLNNLGIRWVLLTGRQTTIERRNLLRQIASGEAQLIIGTHALIEKPVHFSKLMLAVIDEQHRFGVEHRSLLRQKGEHPDVLVMTATPDSEDISLDDFGDLDISTLDELPPGRTPINTYHVPESQAYAEIKKEIQKGRQAYIVYPLVQESDKIELKSVVKEAQHLRKTVFEKQNVGVLHGQLKSGEKESIMEQFRRGELDILMATSIIEVGIDVPNATLMVIHHAERFGLASLHQLRGRVGRGSHPSCCLLIADPKTPEARERIRVMTEIQDGFQISEADLSLRGPGEALGHQQHGMPQFRIGHLIHDAHLIQEARLISNTTLSQDPLLERPEHRILRHEVIEQYQNKWTLGLTG